MAQRSNSIVAELTVVVALMTVAAAFVPAATMSIAATGGMQKEANLVPAGGAEYSTEGSASTFGMQKDQETRGNKEATLGESIGLGKNAIYG